MAGDVLISMVVNTHIRTLLDIDDIPTKVRALRRAFTAYTESIDLTGEEALALIVLVNLTHPKKNDVDLLDIKLARKTLKNQSYINSCINEVPWMHTHNLKYPDIRVSRQNLRVKVPPLHSGILSSANCYRTLGWSHDSAKINFSKLFCCHFIWQNKIRCLADILCDMPIEWKKAFNKLGMPVNQFEDICTRIKGLLPDETVPNAVDRYSIQVRMPYHDGYVAITPVLSHAVQAEIQQAAIKKQGSFTQLKFTRPASVSELVASLGGSIYALNYPPRTQSRVFTKSDNVLHQLLSQKSLFRHQVLSRVQFAKVIDELLSNSVALTLKQRRQQKIACLKQIRKFLAEWLEQIIDLRTELKDKSFLIKSLELGHIIDSLEFRLLTFSDAQLPELLGPLLGLLNTEMSNSISTGQYAFHQKLMPTFRKSLKWLITHSVSEATHAQYSEIESTQRYFYLKGIRVFDAQALSTPYCAGVPSLTAVWGMMHNFQRRLNERLGTQLRMTSFSWFIRQFSFVKGKKLPELGMHGTAGKEFRRPGIIDNRYCDLVFDLIIHIDGYEQDLEDLDNQLEIVKSSFPASFAGGVMHPPGLDEPGDWCDLYKSETALFAQLKKLPLSGQWVMPTKFNFVNVDQLLYLLDVNTSLCPVMFGYLPLTKPDKRAGSIEPLHCYAETVIGIVECTSAIEVRLQGQVNYFNRAFWMLEAKEQSMLMKRI
ncbi:type I-F CRISPR-associated protein Csy2 [Paraglaciecola sp.]|uniref:type I-F CRISPR-associated protein Csy2 n=1 Tax=Paraglaciecola sp. TaxID=1920173 RepID=UPI00273FE9B2|nr:type I-F CRISPR-associated protein Csy2 [Paraglaciecola sp.]MDP5032820.1 hypothetical protein [Paraglaciecola sp.]